MSFWVIFLVTVVLYVGKTIYINIQAQKGWTVVVIALRSILPFFQNTMILSWATAAQNSLFSNLCSNHALLIAVHLSDTVLTIELKKEVYSSFQKSPLRNSANDPFSLFFLVPSTIILLGL